MNKFFLAGIGGILLSGVFAALLIASNVQSAPEPPVMVNFLLFTELV
ncbi:hypothetical protein MNBD_ALPHA09-1544 [hydrothermal vent metagenome]|uniref:Uncharacterized protein n=1 Tax=hydrothermal vent metagenome TaxID=652676 RepID=A0A3B0U8W6_9ZZZZ